MKSLDTLFAVLALALALSSAIGLAAEDHHVYGGQEMQALSDGFDALARQVFDCRICAGATLGAATTTVAMVTDKCGASQ